MKWPVSWNCNNTAGPEHFGIWWRRNGQSQNSFKYLCKYADNRLRGIFSRIGTFECCVRVWEKTKRFVKIDVMSWRVKSSAAIILPQFTTSDENACYQPTQSMSSSVHGPPSPISLLSPRARFIVTPFKEQKTVSALRTLPGLLRWVVCSRSWCPGHRQLPCNKFVKLGRVFTTSFILHKMGNFPSFSLLALSNLQNWRFQYWNWRVIKEQE